MELLMTRAAWSWLTLLALSTAVAGCFSPREAPCAFTCVSAEKLCPEGYLCGDDGLCHRITAPGDEGICLLNPPPDGGTNSALSTDAGVD
jgi:hypothetical protein